MDLINEYNRTVGQLPEFVFGIYQDQSALGGHFRAALEQGTGVFLELLVIRFTNDTLRNNVFTRDVLVVIAMLSFRRRGNNRRWKGVVFLHPFW